jgi:hypothetical protein
MEGGLKIGFEDLWSFGRRSCCASGISSCQWQSLDSSEDVTFAGGGSQREHVDVKEDERRRGRRKGASK